MSLIEIVLDLGRADIVVSAQIVAILESRSNYAD